MRANEAKSAEWIRRTLTDEPGKGMGAPFSEGDAQMYLRSIGLAPPGGPPAEAELIERMRRWLEEHRD
jgi:hypothetical protein